MDGQLVRGIIVGLALGMAFGSMMFANDMLYLGGRPLELLNTFGAALKDFSEPTVVSSEDLQWWNASDPNATAAPTQPTTGSPSWRPTKNPTLRPTAFPTAPPVVLPAIRCKRVGAFKETVSNRSDRRFVSIVVNPRRNRAALELFRKEWEKVWPGLDPSVANTYVDHPSLTGIAATSVMYSSMLEAVRCTEDFDYVLVLQDYALPAPNAKFPDVLDSVLEEFDAANGTGLLLGGSFWRGAGPQETKKKCAEGRCIVGLQLVTAPFAFDGILFPKRAIQAVTDGFDRALSAMNSSLVYQVPASYMQWFYWKQFGGGAYVTDPHLLMRAPTQAQDNSWKMDLPGERCKEVETFKRTVSPISNRTFLAGTITLPNAPKWRVEDFRQAWHRAWPELEHTWFYSWHNPFSKRGMANTAGHYRTAVEAIRCGGDFDYLMLFEDDGIPFEGAKYPDDLDRLLDTFEAHDGSGLNLGGHMVSGHNKVELYQTVLPKRLGLIRATQVYGSYAMLVPRKYLVPFAARYELGLSAAQGDALVPDKQNWKVWRSTGGGGYVTAPLLVDHRPRSTWSFTWHKHAIRKFEGKREWWKP